MVTISSFPEISDGGEERLAREAMKWRREEVHHLRIHQRPVQLHPKLNPTAVYLVNLVIMLANCNGLNQSKAVTVGTLVLGMLTTVLSVLYSALRAGSSTTFLSPSPPSSPRASAETKPLLGDEEMEEGKGKEKETECRPKILYASDNDGKAIAEAQAMVASFIHQQKEGEEAAKVVSLTDSQK
ncbi:hypothetical protein LINPERHAP2_LOCUS37581 [Linum perenne]